MPTLADIRQKFPQYADLDDQQLVDGLHAKHYADLPREDFYARVGYQPPARWGDVAAAAPDYAVGGAQQGIGGAVRMLAEAGDVGQQTSTGGALRALVLGGLGQLAAPHSREAAAAGAGIAESGRRNIEAARPDGALSTVQRGALTAAQSAGTMVPSMMLGGVGGTPAALASMGAMTGGTAFDEARDQGRSIDDSLARAGIQGGIEVATEALPTKYLLDAMGGKGLLANLAKYIASEQIGEQAATLGQSTADVVQGYRERPDGQGFQTVPEYFRDDYPREALDTAVATLITSGAVTPVAAAADAAKRRLQTPSAPGLTVEAAEKALQPAYEQRPGAVDPADLAAGNAALAQPQEAAQAPPTDLLAAIQQVAQAAGLPPSQVQATLEQVAQQTVVEPAEVAQAAVEAAGAATPQVAPISQLPVTSSFSPSNEAPKINTPVATQGIAPAVGVAQTETAPADAATQARRDAATANRSAAARERVQRDRMVRPEADDLLAAIAKLGGISREQAQYHGIDPAEFGRRGWKIARIFTTNGAPFDRMAELLDQRGYPVHTDGQYSVNGLLDSLDRALRGEPVGAAPFLERIARGDDEQRAAHMADLEAQRAERDDPAREPDADLDEAELERLAIQAEQDAGDLTDDDLATLVDGAYTDGEGAATDATEQPTGSGAPTPGARSAGSDAAGAAAGMAGSGNGAPGPAAPAAADDDAPFSRQPARALDRVSPRPGAPASALQPILDRLLAPLKGAPPVKVVQSVAELPERLRAIVERKGAADAVEGAWFGDTVYLIADRLPTAQRAAQVLVHEIVGHHGLRGLFQLGDGAGLVQFDRLLDDITAAYRAGKFDQWFKDPRQRRRLDLQQRDTSGQPLYDLADVASAREAAEEFLARLTEYGKAAEPTGFLERVRYLVAGTLRRYFGSEAEGLTRADIDEIIARAGDYVRRGGAARDDFAGSRLARLSRDTRDTRTPDLFGDYRGQQPADAEAKAQADRERDGFTLQGQVQPREGKQEGMTLPGAQAAASDPLQAIGMRALSSGYEWAQSYPRDYGSDQYNVRHAGTPKRYTVRRSGHFRGGITGSPTVVVGTFDSAEQAAEAVRRDVEKRTGSDGARLARRGADDPPDLIVQHNLSAANLMHAHRMGGLAVPSLAVTRVGHPLEGFGEITLLGDADLANPKGYAGTRVYGGDIYSPRYPTVSYRMKEAHWKRLATLLKPYEQDGDMPARFYDSAGPVEDQLMRYPPFKRYAAERGDDGTHDGLKMIAQDLLRDAGAEEKLFQGFTYAGNRRYAPHTLERVVKILKKELVGGEGGNYGVGSLRAKFTPRFSSLDAIRKAKGRLRSKADFAKVEEEIDAEFWALADQLKASHDQGDKFGFGDILIDTLKDAATMGLPRAFRENQFFGVPDEVQQEAAGFLAKLRDLPTEYFEAKILRDVDLAEFKAAVVPTDAPKRVREILEGRGVQVFEYDRQAGEQARQSAIARATEAPGMRFSRQTAAGAQPAAPSQQAARRSVMDAYRQRIGQPAYNAVARWVTRTILDKFALAPMTPALREQMRAYRTEVARAQRLVAGEDGKGGLARALLALPEAQRQQISDIIEGELRAGDVPPEQVQQTAMAIAELFDRQSRALVEAGMLTEEARQRWAGEYLPRYYAKHEAAIGGKLNHALRRAFMKIDGRHMKGRGLFEHVPAGEVADWEARGWQRREPAQGQAEVGEAGSDTVLMWRDYTREERERMGEIRDGAYRTIRGYLESAADLAKGRLFQRMAKDPRLASKGQLNGWVQVPDTTVPGTGLRRYGAMSGLWTTPEVMAELEHTADRPGALAETYLELLSLWKEGKTSLNPVVHGNNIATNVVIAHFAGVPVWSPAPWRDTLADYRGKGEFYREAVDNGLLGTEWMGAEIRAMMPELGALTSVETAAASRVQKVMRRIYGAGPRQYREAMNRAYQAEDQFFKLMIYRHARQKMGMDVQPAIDYAERYIFNYAELPKGARFIRNTLLPFFSYTYKAAPMVVHTAMVNPHRLLAVSALAHGVNALAYWLLGDDADEEDERAVMPDWMGGGTAIGTPKNLRMPWNGPNGEAVFMDIYRRVPLGDVADAQNQAGGVPLPAPLTPNNPLLTMAAALLWNVDTFTGDPVVESYDGGADKARKWAGYVLRQALPNTPLLPGAYSFDKAMNGVANATGTTVGPYTGTDYYGNATEWWRMAADVLTGTKFRVVDVERERGKRLSESARQLRDLRGDMRGIGNNQGITDAQREAELERLRAAIPRIEQQIQEANP